MATKPPTARLQAIFLPAALKVLRRFPADVKSEIGHAIHTAQMGGKHPSAKPLTGHTEFRGASVLEVVEDFDGNTYRAVYTVRFKGAVYVLHAFQKKSTSGIETPQVEIETIKKRLKLAEDDYKERLKSKRPT
ncbi:MAG TPA: type II toxin-antitoxin system RelE/ParE family toxin [Beijerinckiaceae bacterium]|nr:type II toxin-antitoxin system RelE/ParE family toxin [Beijerinckiaceae bacterium]